MKPVDQRKRLAKLKTFGGEVIQKQAVTLADRGIDPKKFMRVVDEAITRHPDIYQADMTSFGRAVQSCCRDGLVPDGYQAAMFVKKNGEVDYMPMVGGYQLAAKRALGVRPIVGSVKEHDEWHLHIVPGKPVDFWHKPALELEDRGPVVFAYIWVKMPDGSEQFRYLDRGELAKNKAASKSKDKALWNKYPARASEKSVANSLLRFLRYDWMDSEDAEQLATILDNDADYQRPESGGDAEIVDAEFEDIPESQVQETTGGVQAPTSPSTDDTATPLAAESAPPPPSTEEEAATASSRRGKSETKPPPPPPPPPPSPPPPKRTGPAKTTGAVGDVSGDLDLPF